MLGLKLNHVSNRGHSWHQSLPQPVLTQIYVAFKASPEHSELTGAIRVKTKQNKGAVQWKKQSKFTYIRSIENSLGYILQ